jgi:hypothetical protein
MIGPEWWMAAVGDADAPRTGADDEVRGMLLSDCSPDNELGELDKMIADLELAVSQQRTDRAPLVENLEGDDGGDDGEDLLRRARKSHRNAPPRASKKFMTLADLPGEYDFFAPPPAPPPADAIMMTGRRLGDGQRVSSIQAPALGLDEPVYVRDCVLPVLGVLLCIMMATGASAWRQNAMAKRIESMEAERRGMLHLLLMSHGTHGGFPPPKPMCPSTFNF